jgi:hypothetical protein
MLAVADPDTGSLKPEFQEDWGDQLDFDPVTLVPVWWPHEADGLVMEENPTEEERVVNFGWNLEAVCGMFGLPSEKLSGGNAEPVAMVDSTAERVLKALLWLRGVVVSDY